MNKVLYCFLSLVFISCSGTHKTAGISGKIIGIETGRKIYLSNRSPALSPAFKEIRYDSVFSTDGNFRFRPYKFRHVGYRSIQVEGADGWIPFLIDDNKIFISAKADSFISEGKVLGSPSNDIIKEYYRGIYNPWTDSLRTMQEASSKYYGINDSLKAKAVESLYMQAYKSAVTGFFERYLHFSPTAAFLSLTYRRFNEYFPDEELKKYFLQLPKEEQDNPMWESMRYTLTGQYQSNIREGVMLPNFRFKNEHGKTIRLNDLKAKYKLLDFWAGWCVPCLEKVPEIDSIHKLYKAKGLEVIAVNIDNDFASFEKALARYGADFPKMYTGNPAHSAIYKYLDIRSIPFLLLLDAENRIIRYNLSTSDIHALIK